ncbi:hypothetical protein BKH42_08190 [Helicobacter sp. 13S00482-2]|uniref:VirB8/TrbF family protein n=1 Tax=Helicobacter sp. 13S00482-2 TaxID=1476200 RepID=UPI000BA6AF1C|nr:VirB8/TrbF family protein [Helicobacter sp. 13S00482-2]PAF53024.1 hypothetical protein BKH42_08190 [Helicobacter sp. 13S00482-2]
MLDNKNIKNQENDFNEDVLNEKNSNQESQESYNQDLNKNETPNDGVELEEIIESEILEEEIKQTQQSPKIKKIKSVISKIKQNIEDLILPKIRQKMHSKSIFETVQDAGSIFKIERKIGDYLILIAGFFFLISFVEFILILSLFPLKEKEPYLVTFTNDTQSFAIIQKADQSITANEALNRQLLGAYILNRESINRIDDKQRSEMIREQSSSEVWNVFERIIAQEDSIYNNKNLTRVIKIVNIALIKKGYANADVSISLFANGVLKSEKRYRIIISYKFKTIEINYNSLPKNPTGFTVTGYSITEIATIKELPDENKKNTSKSRIKYRNSKDKSNSSDDILNEAYIYQENKKEEINSNPYNQQDYEQQYNIDQDKNFIDLNNKTNKVLDSNSDSLKNKKQQISDQIKQLEILLEEHQKEISQEDFNEIKREILQLRIQEKILESKNIDNSNDNYKIINNTQENYDTKDHKDPQNNSKKEINSINPRRIQDSINSNNNSDEKSNKPAQNKPSKDLPSPFSSNQSHHSIIKKG